MEREIIQGTPSGKEDHHSLQRSIPEGEPRLEKRRKIDSYDNLPKGYFKEEASNIPHRDLFTRNECSSREKLVQSDCENKYCAQDVFLSHSGAQKNFVRQLHRDLTWEQLHRDLTWEGVSCFFDEDRQSLPFAEKFPPRIFEAAQTCRVAVLVLSMEFIQSKWPLLELSAFVNAICSGKNPNLKLLPLFFKISPKALSEITLDNQYWTKLEIPEKTRIEWHKALREVRSIKGLPFNEGEDELRLRDKIVEEIRSLLPESPRYFVAFMRGQTRMCEELETLFKRISPSGEKGIHIAGLYGLAGSGKTTLSMAFCNFNLKGFEGKVCHVEFQSGKSVETVKHVLQHLTHSTETLLNSLTTKEVAWEMFRKKINGQRALLVVDNITEDPEIIEEVRVYLGAEFGRGNRILLAARSPQILNNFIPAKSCMHVPSLTEEEATSILLDRTSLRESNLKAKDRGFVLKCARRCWFRESSDDMVGVGRFHPLALKAFGGYLFRKFGSDLSKWIGEMSDFARVGSGDLQDVFVVLGKAYHGLVPKYRTIFMLLSLYLPPNMSSDDLYKWLAIACNEGIFIIENAVRELLREAFIESIEPEIRVHDLLIEFARYEVDKRAKWLWVKGEGHSPHQLLISEDEHGFELARFENCRYLTPSRVGKKFLENLLALQLVHMQNFTKLDLSSMDNARSITIHNCPDLEVIEGMDNLSNLGWLQIIQVNPRLKFPMLSVLEALQYLEMDIPNYNEVDKKKPSSFQSNSSAMQLGDLTGCVFLKEIYVCCPFLTEFPKVCSLPYLEKVEFVDCFNVRGALDCTGCSELRTLVFNFCTEMAYLPLISGCSKLSKLVMWQCNALTACPEIKGQSAVETLESWVSSEAGQTPIHFDSCLRMKNLQLWKLGQLKMLPDLSSLSKLVILPESFEEPKALKYLDLSHCKALERLPESFGQLAAVETLMLRCCTALHCLPESFGELKALKDLDLNSCEALERLPESSGELKALKYLDLSHCMGLQRLPESFGQLASLETLMLRCCTALHCLPESFGELKALKDLYLNSCEALERLPESFGELKALNYLDLSHCKALERLPESFGQLAAAETLMLSCCIALLCLQESFGQLKALKDLDLSCCEALERLPESFGELKALKYLDLSHCKALERLPESFEQLAAVETVMLRCCIALQCLPESFGELKALKDLYLNSCEALERLPESFGKVKTLKCLDLSHCKALDRLPESFGQLAAIETLMLSCCTALQCLPESFGELKALERLDLSSCKTLERLPESFSELKALKYLDLSYCKGVERVPAELTSVQYIYKKGIHIYKRIE